MPLATLSSLMPFTILLKSGGNKGGDTTLTATPEPPSQQPYKLRVQEQWPKLTKSTGKEMKTEEMKRVIGGGSQQGLTGDR